MEVSPDQLKQAVESQHGGKAVLLHVDREDVCRSVEVAVVEQTKLNLDTT